MRYAFLTNCNASAKLSPSTARNGLFNSSHIASFFVSDARGANQIIAIE
jgi:hypothetical protein